MENSSLIPEKPRAKVFARISIIARTVGVSNGLPTPTAWLTTTFRWSRSTSSRLMILSLNAPNPVVIP